MPRVLYFFCSGIKAPLQNESFLSERKISRFHFHEKTFRGNSGMLNTLIIIIIIMGSHPFIAWIPCSQQDFHQFLLLSAHLWSLPSLMQETFRCISHSERGNYKETARKLRWTIIKKMINSYTSPHHH